MGACLSKKDEPAKKRYLGGVASELEKSRNLNPNMLSGTKPIEFLHQYSCEDKEVKIRYFTKGFASSMYQFELEPTSVTENDDGTFSSVLRYTPIYYCTDEQDVYMSDGQNVQVAAVARRTGEPVVSGFSHQRSAPLNVCNKLLNMESVLNLSPNELDDYIMKDAEQEGQNLVFHDENSNILQIQLAMGKTMLPWFGCALSSMLTKPILLKPILDSYNPEQPNSKFSIPLCKQGMWNAYEVDKKLPFEKRAGQPLSTVTTKNEYWPAILEKALLCSLPKPQSAWRKLKNVGYASNDLAGCPYQEIFFKEIGLDEAQLDQYLTEELAAGYILSAFPNSSYATPTPDNFFNGTFYQIVKKVKSRNGDTYYAIRYPWNTKLEPTTHKLNRISLESSGAINPTSPELQGCVFLTPRSVYDYFDVVLSVKLDPMAGYQSIQPVDPPDPYIYFEIDFKESGMAIITISQEEIFQPNMWTNLIDYRTIGLVILRKEKIENGEEWRVVEQTVGKNRDVWIRVNLEKGSYLVAAYDPKAKIGQYVNLCAYSRTPLRCHSVSKSYFYRKLGCPDPDPSKLNDIICSSMTATSPLPHPSSPTSTHPLGTTGISRTFTLSTTILSPLIYSNGGRSDVDVELRVDGNGGRVGAGEGIGWRGRIGPGGCVRLYVVLEDMNFNLRLIEKITHH